MDILEAKRLAIELMNVHGISDWNFKFDKTKTRFGLCNYTNKVISLSLSLTRLNDKEVVEQTILHEIAHVLTKSHGHNHIWLNKARSIGYKGDRLIDRNSINMPESKYIAVCCNCNHTYRMYRKSKYNKSCGFCSGGSFNPKYKLEFILNPNS